MPDASLLGVFRLASTARTALRVLDIGIRELAYRRFVEDRMRVVNAHVERVRKQRKAEDQATLDRTLAKLRQLKGS
jgi:hypothetical protein